MLDADINVDDMESRDGRLTLFAPADEFFKAKTALLEVFPDIELEVQEITFVPQSYIDISEEDLLMVFNTHGKVPSY